MTFFKIRNSKGQFSKGGSDVEWSKSGKSWAMRGHLSNHFALLSDREMQAYELAGAEVVEYEMIEKKVEPTAVWAIAAIERRNANRSTYDSEWARKERERDMKELKRIKDKYGLN